MKKAAGFLILLICVMLLAAIPAGSTAESGDGTGTVRVLAFNDKNGNGFQGYGEDGVAGITVRLVRGEETIAETETGSDGIALFENVPAGVYHTRAILPLDRTFSEFGGEGSLDANAFRFSTEGEQDSGEMTVAAGAETQQGLAVQLAYYVAGFCWQESEADGLYREGEPMLAGVRITLDGQKNGLHYETVSEADGTWRIDRVRPAFYTMTVYVPDGMMFTRYTSSRGIRSIFTQDAVSKASKTVDLNDKTSRDNQYVGFARAAEVRGICYLDINYNGYYDEGEPPLAGVKMTAIKQATDEEIAVTRSGEDGTFVLTGLRENTYKIRAVLPEDGSTFTVTAEGENGNHFKSRPDRRENFWKDFELKDGQTREIAVGAIYPAVIKGTVYMDDDFSATLNGKEKIVTTFLVTLLDKDGEQVTADKSNVKGVYELTGVVPGEYTLSVTAVKGYAFTRLGDENVILNRTGGEGYSEPFRVESGDVITGMDIGMIRPAKVQGTVFADRNDNGIRDAVENGLAGVTVRLMNGEEECFRAEIGEDAAFLFDAVMPGSYYIEYILPEGAVFAKPADGGNTVIGDGVGWSETFAIQTGDDYHAALCGALTLGSISGTAYRDHNGNGIQDPEEEPISGMTFTLVPSREDLEEMTAVTGEDGAFALEDLHPDVYTLRVECPKWHVLSRTDALELPLTAGKAEQEVSLDVAMGSTWRGQMAGAVMPAVIRGRVWLDENCNGLFDPGEQTPAGLTVTVTDELTGSVFDTPVTDEGGYYQASGMIPGSFSVSFPLDDRTVAPPKGENQFDESDGCLVLTGIRLEENELREGLLLGIIRYTEISGRVWMDRGGETEPLSGASITLTDGNGTAIQRAFTGDEGTYRFARLMPGTYQLEAEMPEGCVVIEPDDRRLNGETVSVMTYTRNRTGTSDLIDLKMNQDRKGMDIGCVLPGNLGDLCWLDLDGDGLQGAGEGGIPGVRVEAQRNGETVAEAVSDQYGFYRITDLYPGVYTLKVTPPQEVKPTAHSTDIPMIASVLEEMDEAVCYSCDVPVESDQANYNADLGFVLRNQNVLPAGYGEGKTQNWQKK